MATVTELLGVLQVAVATCQPHHGCLGVIQGGALAVQAVGADGTLNHVELLKLGHDGECRWNNVSKSESGVRQIRHSIVSPPCGTVNKNRPSS